jgi:hypothetical protein
MFKVENADFIADKLAAELLPNQEFREVLKNALEAVQRRMAADGKTKGGRIEFDVDWTFHGPTWHWYVACADNGDGMTRSELEKYTTTLAVQGAGNNQSIRGNQGMGLKIAGPTRHKKGLVIRSWKHGERTRLQVGWNENESQYGLIPIGPNDELVLPTSEELFPKFIRQQKSGTVVTFLGNADGDNTFVPGIMKNWLFKYLNTRFFRLSNDGVEVVVRVPSGEQDEWPHTLDDATLRMKGQGGKSFNLQLVNGTGKVWDNAAEKGGDKGTLEMPGEPSLAIPPAKIHWWIMPSSGTDVSSRTHGGGSFAVLYDNELHDWKTTNHANAFFARLGILFGKSRIMFILEPQGPTFSADFARAHVLMGGSPVFETDAWLLWSEQFRKAMPQAIRHTIDEERDKLQAEDPDRMKRIRERLREVMQLLRPRRFRRAQQGEPRSGPNVVGGGSGVGSLVEMPTKSGPRRRRSGGRGIGAVLSDLEDQDATPAQEVHSTRGLEPIWVTEEEAESMSILNGNSNGLHDRAAALAGQDGRTADVLLLNRDFRGYQTMVVAVNEWANPEADDDKAAKIESLVREWTEQKMIEAVEGLRQLENGRTWLTEHYDEALSPVALTAAFMADRYHTLREVKRAVGALRQTSGVAAA